MTQDFMQCMMQLRGSVATESICGVEEVAGKKSGRSQVLRLLVRYQSSQGGGDGGNASSKPDAFYLSFEDTDESLHEWAVAIESVMRSHSRVLVHVDE